MSILQALKQPSAWLPIFMSFAALIVVCLHVAFVGTERETDEGAAAHIFQLLMVAQVPFLISFAIKWVPRAPMPALLTLGLQFVSAVAAMAPVFILRL